MFNMPLWNVHIQPPGSQRAPGWISEQKKLHFLSSFDDDALSFHPPSSSRTPFAPFHLAAAAVLHLVDAVSGYAVVKAALTLTLAAEATWAWISPGTPPQPRPTL